MPRRHLAPSATTNAAATARSLLAAARSCKHASWRSLNVFCPCKAPLLLAVPPPLPRALRCRDLLTKIHVLTCGTAPSSCIREGKKQHFRPLSTTCIPTLCAGPLAALFDGFRCTICAWDQTGSGKSNSMMSSGADLTARALPIGIARLGSFRAAWRQSQRGLHAALQRDLLGSAVPVVVTAATRLNAGSSRSHAILTLALTMPARKSTDSGSSSGSSSSSSSSKSVTSRGHLV